MPLDPRAKRFLDMTALMSGATDARPPLTERRKALEKLMQFARADRFSGAGTDGKFVLADREISYRLYAPLSATSGAVLPGIIFFHGGGMVAGSIATHDLICRALCEESGCRLLSIGYRLAPEHRFPAGIEDAVAAVRETVRHAAMLGIDATKLAVCGDSAGATLAAVTCQALRNGDAHISLQCLICPVLDFGAGSASRKEFARGYLIDQTTLAADLADFLPAGVDPADPRVSPLRAGDLRGLPPAIVHTAEFDPLRDEGDAYAVELAAAGVRVDHTCHSGMPHNFHALGGVLPQGREVLRQIGAQIREVIG
jgi:acetyl esterase/lipase